MSVERISHAQAQTARMFGYQWHRRRATWERPETIDAMRAYLLERYGDVANAPWWDEHGSRPVLLDAGCGAGLSSLELFGDRLSHVDYIGVEISEAIEVAQDRFRSAGLSGHFIRGDFSRLAGVAPDVIFAEGTMHHTDSTEGAMKHLAGLLKPGGRFLFYVYRRKGPIREFTDDLIRKSFSDKEPDDIWKALIPLTRLGKTLGELNIEIDIPEPIDLLGIPAGRINLQRLFYWHIAKVYYRPEMTFDELVHANFDWYAPLNAHRQTEQEVRQWCDEAGLEIEHENIQEAGITIRARKR